MIHVPRKCGARAFINFYQSEGRRNVVRWQCYSSTKYTTMVSLSHGHSGFQAMSCNTISCRLVQAEFVERVYCVEFAASRLGSHRRTTPLRTTCRFCSISQTACLCCFLSRCSVLYSYRLLAVLHPVCVSLMVVWCANGVFAATWR